jgi:uncharacterized membrane protein
MWHTNDGMGWWMVFMGIFWILFWGSLIYLFVVAIVRPAQSRQPGEEADALDIAKRRLARGEISPAEFQEIRRHLEENVSGPQPS